MKLPGRILWIVTFAVIGCTHPEADTVIQTVNGPITPDSAGITLTHEHILVDFTGAENYNPGRWNRDSVVSTVLPYLMEAKMLGCRTFVDCTPEFLGRDPLLLKKLSDTSGLNILTNTGWYGAVQHKYLPPEAWSLSEDEIARIWINEWESGIDNTGIRPGFIKISMDFDSITRIQRKLIRAAALTHLSTGLTIAAHTGPAARANEALDILESMGVAPDAWIWVHAQVEKDPAAMIRMAKRGCWVSLDGISEEQSGRYGSLLDTFKKSGLLDHVLLSHDAGWYRPEEPQGGGQEFKPYTSLFTDLIPLLKRHGFSESDIRTLLVSNPVRAFGVRVRKIPPVKHRVQP